MTDQQQPKFHRGDVSEGPDDALVFIGRWYLKIGKFFGPVGAVGMAQALLVMCLKMLTPLWGTLLGVPFALVVGWLMYFFMKYTWPAFVVLWVLVLYGLWPQPLPTR